MDVPIGHTSGSHLSSSTTWDNATFSSLGLTTGTYDYTWGSGANADSFTINIGTAVPEPSSLVLMGVGGITGLGYARRRRRSRVIT